MSGRYRNLQALKNGYTQGEFWFSVAGAGFLGLLVGFLPFAFSAKEQNTNIYMNQNQTCIFRKEEYA